MSHPSMKQKKNIQRVEECRCCCCCFKADLNFLLFLINNPVAVLFSFFFLVDSLHAMDEKPRTVAAISNVIANNTSVISVFDWRLGGGDCESIGFQSVKLVGLIQPENFPTVLVSNMNLKTELEFRFFFFCSLGLFCCFAHIK